MNEETKINVAQETAETKEEVKVETKETKAEQKQNVETKESAADVDVQQLMVDLAKARRDRDKACSEASEYKKKWKESLSEVEKASMEKAEKEAAREEEYQRLLRENSINKLEKTYLAMGWTAAEASRMATAEADGDFDSKVKIMTEVREREKKEMEKSILANYADVNIGGGTSQTVTKEQFDSMNPVELTKLKRENPAEYDRLIAM